VEGEEVARQASRGVRVGVMVRHPAPLPHDEIQQLFPDVYAVRGTFRMNAFVSFSRTMTVLREGSALTLVNSIRLSPEGEKKLLELGEIKHLVKLGGYHGIDDPYYRERFAARYWSPQPADSRTEKLVDGKRGPIEGTSAFVFERSPAESALLLEQGGGNLLITCDSVQNWTDTRLCSLAGALVVRGMGFVTPAKLGPIWLKRATGGDPSLMWPDFERMLALDFQHLISGHGEVMRGEARSTVARSCEKTLGPRRG
jgi:hypothetical protein